MSQIKTKFIEDLAVTTAKIADTNVTNAKIANATIDLTTKVTGALPVANGGTGQTSYTDGQLLIGNTTGNTLAKATLTAGSGINITNGSGSITIATTGTSAVGFNVTSQNTTYSAVINDYIICSGASFTITLPTAVGKSGQQIAIQHNGTSLTQVYTLNTTSSQTIDGIASGSYALYTNKEKVVLTSDGSNWSVTDHFASTNWVNANVVQITATTSNPTKGSTQAVDKFYWRRIGKNLEGRIAFRQTNATGSAAGNGDYLFEAIPNGSGITIDTNAVDAYSTVEGSGTYTTNNTVGVGVFGDGSTVAFGAQVHVYDTTRVRIMGSNGTTTGSPGSGIYAITSTAAFYMMSFSVPITEFQP